MTEIHYTFGKTPGLRTVPSEGRRASSCRIYKAVRLFSEKNGYAVIYFQDNVLKITDEMPLNRDTYRHIGYCPMFDMARVGDNQCREVSLYEIFNFLKSGVVFVVSKQERCDKEIKKHNDSEGILGDYSPYGPHPFGF